MGSRFAINASDRFVGGNARSTAGECDHRPEMGILGHTGETAFIADKFVASDKTFPTFCRIGAPEETRTPNPQIRSLVLYPIELRVPAERGFS